MTDVTQKGSRPRSPRPTTDLGRRTQDVGL